MKLVVPSRSSKLLLERATAEYQSQLLESPGAYDLLEQRGLTQETIEHFRLGYVGSPLQGDEKFTGRISIPYQTVSGIVTVRYRATTDENPKYLSASGDSGRPFNVASLRGAGSSVVITEGEMDAIIMWQLGYASVGIPGATMWNTVYSRLFRYRTVYLLADGDKAGRDLGQRIGADLPGLIVLNMPPGSDVNDVYLAHGAGYFKELIDE